MAARKVTNVIGQIMELVPTAQTSLRTRLDAVAQSARFTAPEAMGRIWRRLADVLTEELPWPTVEEWQAQIGRIVRGEQ